MPNFEEHCESTGKKLDCRFERVHKWMDSPSQYMGKSHRLRRHDPYKTPEIAKGLFSKYYPNHAHLIEEAVLDHIELDRNGGDFTYSTAQENLMAMDMQDDFRRLEKESRRKTLKSTPKWFALFIASSIASYLSILYDPTHTSPLIAIFVLAAGVFLFGTVCCVGEGLGFEAFSFGVWTFMEIGVIIFLLLFGINPLTLMVFGFFTGWYLLMWIVRWYSMRLESENKKLRSSLRQTYEIDRRREIQKPEPEEEPDFVSEENLEAHGIPSSAAMDLEDIEE